MKGMMERLGELGERLETLVCRATEKAQSLEEEEAPWRDGSTLVSTAGRAAIYLHLFEDEDGARLVEFQQGTASFVSAERTDRGRNHWAYNAHIVPWLHGDIDNDDITDFADESYTPIEAEVLHDDGFVARRRPRCVADRSRAKRRRAERARARNRW